MTSIRITTLIIIILVIFGNLNAQLSSDSLVIHFPFTGNSNDISGNEEIDFYIVVHN